MSHGPSGMRWSIERRLEFIEFRLYWDGQINRSDLVETFDISVPQASADLSRYQEVAPRNLEYDAQRKTYVRSGKFHPKFLEPSARYFLSQLRAIDDEAVKQTDTWLGHIPSFAIVPQIRRRLDPDRLQRVMHTIRARLALRIKYQSLTRPDAEWRWIAPHALAFDGYRWHVRAWCAEHNEFRDFTFSRMYALGEEQTSDINPTHDLEWHRMVSVRLGPNPKLPVAHRTAVELDYGMKHGQVEIETRLCLVFYLERYLSLDLKPSIVGAERQQVVLLNKDEIEKSLKATKTEQQEMLARARKQHMAAAE